MYLKKLEIHGFKSFAKKTVLEFEPGITSIVGPNGAGKSNLADGLRWVFGEQSLKLLRGKKTEDVIFAGSTKHARLGGAEVSVYFDNSDRVMPIDYTEVVISRRLYREGNSEYLINGSQTRLLDIQDLLARSGFGNTSYHVIGQGMIDQLILGGPAAIKELMEEASGVKPYYLKRERTIRRLERTETNLGQVEALLREIEPRLRSLRRQTRKLERREVFERELKAAQKLYYGHLLAGLGVQLEEVNGKIAVFDKQLQGLGTEIASLSRDIEQEEKGQKESGPIFKKLRSGLEALYQEKQKVLEEQALLRGKIQAHTIGPLAAKIDWQKIKAKFKEAREKFDGLLEQWDLEKAKKLQTLLAELDQELTAESESISTNDRETKRLEELAEIARKLTEEVEKTQTELATYTDQEEQRKSQLFVKERLLRNKQDTLVKTEQAKNLLAVEQAKLLTRKEGISAEAAQALGPAFAESTSQVPSAPVVASELQSKILQLKKQLEVIGGVDELTLQEYRETEERYQYLANQSADLKKAASDLKTAIKELDEVIKKEFHAAFAKISEKFAEYFRVLFGGGKATMSVIREKPAPLLTSLPVPQAGPTSGEETEEQEDSPPLVGGARGGNTEITGIDIRATPPGKKLAGVAALSGGERALTSIALLCAILATYPSPFVVLDEVDAALDEANSVRFGKILGSLAHQTQFITITHNRETMRQSHTLYGVTMGEDGISRVLSLKLEQAAAYSSKK